jgi:hypothetical protein
MTVVHETSYMFYCKLKNTNIFCVLKNVLPLHEVFNFNF